MKMQTCRNRSKIARTLMLAPILALAVGCAPSADDTESDESNLTFGDTIPANNAQDVQRDLPAITVKYNSQIDCNNPIRGKEAFRVSTTTLVRGKLQEIWDQMDGPSFGPQITCDPVRNEISMELPGLLVGGALFHVDTTARGADGSPLTVSTRFHTRNPGLLVMARTVRNEIADCDTVAPWGNSYMCDVYLVSRGKPDVSSNVQMNGKLPGDRHDWEDWPRGSQAVIEGPPAVLYQSDAPVGDPFPLELQAFDADGGDGLNKVLAALGAVGKEIPATWGPPVGTALVEASKVIPADTDDNIGAGIFYFSKAQHWGADAGWQTLRIPGRPGPNNQVVVNAFFDEYPASWFWRPPIQ
jgi:hypothetical protein